MWDNITYPFPNCDGRAIEILEWISNCIPHFTWCVITFYAGFKVIVKGALSHLNEVWNGWTDMTVVDYARVVSHRLCVHHSNRNAFSYLDLREAGASRERNEYSHNKVLWEWNNSFLSTMPDTNYSF